MNVTADVNRSSRSIRGPSFWDHRSEIWFKRSGSTLRKPRWRSSEVSTGHPRSRIHGVLQRGVLRTKGDRDGWPRRKRPRIMSSAKLHEIFKWKPIRDKITVWRNVLMFRESTPRKKNSTKVPFVSFFPSFLPVCDSLWRSSPPLRVPIYLTFPRILTHIRHRDCFVYALTENP